MRAMIMCDLYWWSHYNDHLRNFCPRVGYSSLRIQTRTAFITLLPFTETTLHYVSDF